MKRVTNSRELTGISLLVLIPAVATLIFALASCGKTNNAGTTTYEAATSQKSKMATEPDSVFVKVDEMPLFPKGDNALLKFIAENIKYPEKAKKNNITGKVIVRFVVEKDCSVSNVTIFQGVDPLLDAEAVKVISSLPKFEKPAKKDGEAVSVYFMVPIMFALK
jgi:periplasmic protein TonB